MSEGLAIPQRRPRIVVAIGEAIALLAIGIGAGYLLFGSPFTDKAAADAEAACHALERTPELTDAEGAITGVALARWTAANTLAGAAAEQDRHYAPLDEALTRARTALTREHTTESARFRLELDKAYVFCEQDHRE